MEFKLLKQLLLGFFLLMGANASAGIISSLDTHTTTDGSVVNLSGLDWLSWDVTTGQSRAAVENGFGGLIADGWRYASISEYKMLLESVFDSHNGWSKDNADGAQWIYSNIYGRNETSLFNDQYNNIYGADNECGDVTLTCIGHFRMYAEDLDFAQSNKGWSRVEEIDGSLVVLKNQTSQRNASMLVRASSVNIPEPSTLVIFALGMIGLTLRRLNK